MEHMIEVREIAACNHMTMHKQPVVGHPTLHVMIQHPGMYVYVAVEEARIKICCPHCFRMATQVNAQFIH